jgi:hypothetical protein
VSRIDPIGPTTPRTEPVTRPVAGEPAKRRRERDEQRRERRREDAPPRREEPQKGGRLDVRA